MVKRYRYNPKSKRRKMDESLFVKSLKITAVVAAYWLVPKDKMCSKAKLTLTQSGVTCQVSRVRKLNLKF